MRDFAKDREICNAATPGPWYDHNPDDDHYMNAYAVTTSPDEPCVDRFNNDHKEIVAITLLQSPRVVCHEDDRWAENARFIAKARTGWPAALDRIAELEAENARLRTRLLSAAGDDLCRLTQDEIKELTSGAVKIPPKEEFLASCERFHQQIASGPGVLNNCLTLAQLIAENAKLEAENARLKEQLERWNAAKSSMNTTPSLTPTTVANSSS